MKWTKKNILLAALTTAALFPMQIAFVSAADVEIKEVSSGSAVTSSASDWANGIVYGGGGETYTFSVMNKYVTINRGSYTGIFGGMTSTGNASNNVVNFYNENVSKNITGGFTFYDGDSFAGSISNNTVNFYGGTVRWISGGEVGYVSDISDFSKLTGGWVYNNTVNIYGGNITGGVIGGSALVGDSYENTVNVSGGTISGDVIGGEVVNSNGWADDNSVNISGGKISGNVIGGSAYSGSVTGNKIIINGGTVSGDIIVAQVLNPSSTSSATSNVITIEKNPTTGEIPNLSLANLFGFYGSGLRHYGNTLNINTAGLTIKSVDFDTFDKVSFHIPADLQSGGTVLSTSGSSNLDLNKISMKFATASPLTKNDNFTLIQELSSGDIAGDIADSSVNLGVTKDNGYSNTVTLTKSADGIATEILGEWQPPNINSISNLVNTPDPFTMDMNNSILDSGDVESVAPVVDINAITGYNVFLNSGGGRIKSKVGGGGNIKTSSGNYNMGFARTFEGMRAGRLYVAPIFEIASGHYNGSLPRQTGGMADVHGSTKYFAGGFVLRFLNQSGFYYEGSLRGGRVENSYSSTTDNHDSNYKTKATVFTGHLRFGKAQRLSPKTLLDVYTMYSLSRQNGTNADLYVDGDAAQNIDFDSTLGHSFRLGYRLTTKASNISRLYAGLAYQYDKNSSSTLTYNNVQRTTAGAKGSSGMLELGWQIKPNKNVPWIVDITAVGWAGRMRGFNILAKAQKEF